MASFSRAVSVAAPPAEAFPWLVDEDKVPQWTEGTHSYEILGGGPAATGKRIRVTLTVSGRAMTIEHEIVGYQPPSTFTTHSESHGIHVDSVYRVEPEGAGSKVTQTIDLEARGLTAKMLAPMVGKQLETKLEGDLERLREKLAEER